MKRDPDTVVETGVGRADDLSGEDAQFLSDIGRRVRELRERRGLSRKRLARGSSVSERYLAQIETGSGNSSVMLLRRIAAPLGVAVGDLFAGEDNDSVQRRLIRRFLDRLPAHRLEDVIFRLMRDFGHEEAARRKRIALIGLRGAGKSTLGGMLARALAMPLVELNREIARETGLPSGEVMALYGLAAYRRIEERVLERVAREQERAVIVAGGGIVNEEAAFNLLLANCYTVWIKAQPEEHMARVLAQGDFRPMAGNAEAMDDLKRILAAREAMYRKADAIVDTSGETPQQSFARLREAVAA
ncbi:MAG TPA: helix-turn-helix transcriptional regulator [Casimicrobiaceae bacterium]|nr:helix-turn-helix transcriptional regulator [Casimicrobiaceae bacterium]